MTKRPNTEDLEEMALKARIAEHAAKLIWLKPYEAACYMNIGESTLWRLMAEGAIPSSKNRGHVRIERTDIDAYWSLRKRAASAGGKSSSKTESSPVRPDSQNAS